MMPKPGTILGMLGLYVLSASGLARCQETGKLPIWEPSEARSKRLAAESKFDGWAIRPPHGYPHRAIKAGNETRTTWAKQAEGGIGATQAHVDPGQTTLEQGLERYLTLLKGRTRNLSHTPFERGLVNGKTFVRTRFGAEGLPGISGKGYGFVYLTFDAKTPFSVTGFGTETTIEDLEASALTFRILE